MSITVGPGDERGSRRFIDVMEGIRVKRGVGRPRGRPGEVHADSAYDTREIRTHPRRRGIKANIPVNRRSRRRPRRGRPYRLGKETYKRMRSSVERLFSWLKSFRRITIRHERLRTTFIALIQIACILIHLKVLQ
jgi:transposase